MSISEVRVSKIEQLDFLAHTKAEKDIVIEAGKKICDAKSDELACVIAKRYREKLYPFFPANIVDVIAVILKGGHIVEFNLGPKDVTYLVFIPVPDPPKPKTLVGRITKKQFNKLCNKGIIMQNKHLQHTDSRGACYSRYQLAEKTE